MWNEPLVPGLAISPQRYAELVAACRGLEGVDKAGQKLVGLTIPG